MSFSPKFLITSFSFGLLAVGGFAAWNYTNSENSSPEDAFSDIAELERNAGKREQPSQIGRSSDRVESSPRTETLPPLDLASFDLDQASPQLQAEVIIEKVAKEARQRLSELEPSRRVIHQDPAERQKFMELLRSTEDPEERQRLMAEARQLRQQVQDEAEAQLSDHEKTEIKKCQALQKLPHLLREIRQHGWLGEFRSQAESLEAELANLAQQAPALEESAFDSQWHSINQKTNELREHTRSLRSQITSSTR